MGDWDFLGCWGFLWIFPKDFFYLFRWSSLIVKHPRFNWAAQQRKDQNSKSFIIFNPFISKQSNNVEPWVPQKEDENIGTSCNINVLNLYTWSVCSLKKCFGYFLWNWHLLQCREKERATSHEEWTRLQGKSQEMCDNGNTYFWGYWLDTLKFWFNFECS